MRYRNIITGAEFESPCKISAPNWITVEHDIPSSLKQAEDPGAKPDPQKPTKKTATKNPAAGKKGAKK